MIIVNSGMNLSQNDHDNTVPIVGSRLDDAIGIVLKAEEEGQSTELADWLGLHPELAGELARFLVDHRSVQQAATVCLTRNDETSRLTSHSIAGGFEIQEEIGRGGMGVVYKAYDRVLKRTVAVKRVLANQMASEKDLARFRFEAEAAAGLDHPSIVPVHSFGELDGQPFLVMKLMEGGSLANLLKEMGPDRHLSPMEAAKLVRDVALGVHHAHQRGLLHRDLKPANILLDQDGVPHVADFGLAIALQASFSISQGSSLAGTAAYMAPEQVNGEHGLTTSVDIHALGSILYELLTGLPPFGKGEWLVTIQRVRDDTAPSMLRARPDLPRDLEMIVLRCLEKHPQNRYPSAFNLAEDLTRFLDGEPLVANRRSRMADLSRVLARRRDTLSMSSWPGCFVAATSLISTQLAVQAIVLSGVNPWWAYVAFGVHFVGWIGLYWKFLVMRSHVLSPVERLSAALQLGTMVACFSLIPAHIYLHGSDLLPIYGPLTTVFGIGIFAHGATHWGRLYLAGLCLMGVACLLPIIPTLYWPAAHAGFHGGALIWMGFRLRTFDKESQKGLPSRPEK